jgi:hypothetical protein
MPILLCLSGSAEKIIMMLRWCVDTLKEELSFTMPLIPQFWQPQHRTCRQSAMGHADSVTRNAASNPEIPLLCYDM